MMRSIVKVMIVSQVMCILGCQTDRPDPASADNVVMRRGVSGVGKGIDAGDLQEVITSTFERYHIPIEDTRHQYEEHEYSGKTSSGERVTIKLVRCGEDAGESVYITVEGEDAVAVEALRDRLFEAINAVKDDNIKKLN